MGKLLPPKNVRLVYYKCCANCMYRVVEPEWEGMVYCSRTGEDYGNPWGDDPDIFSTVCDGFKKYKYRR